MNSLSLVESILQSEIDPSHVQRARFVLEEINQTQPRRILDAGCGRGFYPRLVSQLDFPQEIVGIDKNLAYLNIAREFNRGICKKVSFQQASIELLPFPDSCFDFVICSEVLEHISDPGRAVNEIARVLRPDGRVAVTVPSVNFPLLWDPLNKFLMKMFATHINKDIHWLAGIWADHIRLFDMQSIKSLFDSFEILRIESRLRYCWPLSHFLLYGLGKVLVERGLFSSLNRFSLEQRRSKVSQVCASFMNLPTRLFGDPRNGRGVNICLAARLKR